MLGAGHAQCCHEIPPVDVIAKAVAELVPSSVYKIKLALKLHCVFFAVTTMYVCMFIP